MYQILAIILLLSPSLLRAECYNLYQSDKELKVIDSSEASASAWSNYWKKPGSLAYQSEIMFKNSKGHENEFILFSSTPIKFLEQYSDKQYCEENYKKTIKDPIRYLNLKFKDIEEFNSWFSEFSQGKGKLGKDLYLKCDRNCSPQYNSYICFSESTLNVDVEVVCGPARDKSDDRYQLELKTLRN